VKAEAEAARDEEEDALLANRVRAKEDERASAVEQEPALSLHRLEHRGLGWEVVSRVAVGVVEIE